MSQLYRSKWISQEGDIFKQGGDSEEFSDGFLLWCRKTEGLTDEQWRDGFEALEEELRQAERIGEANDLWPPGYPAFVEKCKARSRLRNSYFDRSRAIEDTAAKEKRMEKGRQEVKKLLDLFE